MIALCVLLISTCAPVFRSCVLRPVKPCETCYRSMPPCSLDLVPAHLEFSLAFRLILYKVVHPNLFLSLHLVPNNDSERILPVTPNKTSSTNTNLKVRENI